MHRLASKSYKVMLSKSPIPLPLPLPPPPMLRDPENYSKININAAEHMLMPIHACNVCLLYHNRDLRGC